MPSHNRSEWLDKTIASVMKQDTHGNKIEYIVVDNNSSDNTKETVEKHIGSNPNIDLRYVFEEKQGCNFARNRGIEESCGEYIIFFDDDILLEKNCINAYIEAFKKYADAVAFGGRIKLQSPSYDLPPWLVTKGPYLRSMIVVARDLGKHDSQQDFSGYTPVTMNMAVKRSLFEKIGCFRTDLGLCGKKLIPGADYEFSLRIAEQFDSWTYTANALVYHPIKKVQAQKSYFRKRLFGVGRVTYRLHKFESQKRIFGLPVYFLIWIAKFLCLAVKYKIVRKPVESFFYETEMILNCGCVFEHFGQKICNKRDSR